MYQRNYNRIGSKNSALCLRSLPLSLSLSLPHSGETVIDHGSGEEGERRKTKFRTPAAQWRIGVGVACAIRFCSCRKVEISRIRSDPPNNPAIIDTREITQHLLSRGRRSPSLNSYNPPSLTQMLFLRPSLIRRPNILK